MKDESRRQKKIGSLLLEALSRILIEELHEVTTALVTVTRVDVPADLKTAHVYLSVFGPDDPAAIFAHFERRTGFIRKRLASAVKLKYNPVLFFTLDPTADMSERIDRLLQTTKTDGHDAS
ncbi:MAG: 30S ribosome-binding factor RbfA [Candidatus Aminicenantes bacterium]|nr:30S ribosome-binding factor RbfA [Candidatus Aminicenantes bacterium]